MFVQILLNMYFLHDLVSGADPEWFLRGGSVGGVGYRFQITLLTLRIRTGLSKQYRPRSDILEYDV